MAFRFSAGSGGAIPPSEPEVMCPLSKASEFRASGTVSDVRALRRWLSDDASSPSTRLGCCQALQSIAERGDFSGEAGRPLKDALLTLMQMSRRDGDPAVRAAASEASTAVDVATSYLPAWTMVEDASPRPAASSAPVAPLHSPDPDETVPYRDQTPAHRHPNLWTRAISASAAPTYRKEAARAPAMTGCAPAAPPFRIVGEPAPLRVDRQSESAYAGAMAPASSGAGNGALAAPAKRQRLQTPAELGVPLHDHPLYDALSRRRKDLADGRPAFHVASNEVLAAVATRKPRTRAELMTVKGLGLKTCQSYGDALLACVAEHVLASGVGGPPASDLPTGSPVVAAEPVVQPEAAPKAALSDEQMGALRAIQAGESIFLTGGAGTGKSFTLRTIIEMLQLIHSKESVFVTGTTGLAACAIGGTTVHSWAGIGLGKESAQELADKVWAKQAVRKRWQTCRALVIDEVSM